MGNIKSILLWIVFGLVSVLIGWYTWNNFISHAKEDTPESFLYTFYSEYAKAAQEFNTSSANDILKQYATSTLLQQLDECPCGLEADPFLLTQDPLATPYAAEHIQIETISKDDYIYKVTFIHRTNEFFEGGHPFVVLQLTKNGHLYKINHIESKLPCL